MKYILCIISASFLLSCSSKKNIDQLVIKNQLAYAPDSETPYTGEIFSLANKGVGKMTGFYKNGLRNGTWTMYSVGGQKQTIKNFKDEILNGELINFYENGKKKESENYKEGKLDGDYITYYENGNKKEINKYQIGELIGEQKYFYEDGGLCYKSQIELGTKSNEKFRRYFYFYPSGNKLSEFLETYSVGDKNLIIPSTLKIWYRNGKLRSDLKKITDLEYEITSFYNNGNKFYEGTYNFLIYYFIDNWLHMNLKHMKEDDYIFANNNNLPFEFVGINSVKNEISYYENGKTKSNTTHFEDPVELTSNSLQNEDKSTLDATENWYTVITDRSYLYTEPNSATKGKGYIIKDEIVSVLKIVGEFAYCAYDGKGNKAWVLLSALEKGQNVE